MNLNFISGLLLAVVVVAIVAYVIKELLTDRKGGPEEEGLADALAKSVSGEAKPVNEHLIGETGEIIGHSDDADRPLSMRLGTEFWSARSSDDGARQLAEGTTVRVVAVDGPVLVVEEDAAVDAARAPGER